MSNRGRWEDEVRWLKRLSRERLIVLDSFINDEVATHVIAQLLFLSREKPGQEIMFAITGTGGKVYPSEAIHTTMRKIDSPVCTIGIGDVAAVNLLLLAAGQPGRRFVTPACRILLTPSYSESGLLISDTDLLAQEGRRLVTAVLGYTKLSEQEYLQLSPTLSPQEAIKLGFADNLMIIQ